MSKISKIIASLSLIFVLSPIFVSAQTVDELQQQINALLAQIKILQSQITQTQGDASTFCHRFDTNLGVGSFGDEVGTLLYILVKEGVASERGSNFGNIFDETLASAVSSFQEKYKSEILVPVGLHSATGYLGTRTRAKLNALYNRCLRPQQPPTISNHSNPIISGVSGPQSLNVNQQGTWTVTASNPNGGNLSYAVSWGDEGYQTASGVHPLRPPQQSATFTHSYSQAGVYTPTFVVKNDNGIQCVTTPCPTGGSAQTSLSVNVGNTTTSSIVVFSPNGGETWTKGTTQMIQWRDNITNNCPTGAYCSPPATTYYDIKLVPYVHLCGNAELACPMQYTMPYTIVNSAYGFSYNWSVGNIWDTYRTRIINDGAYMIEICKTGSTICDSSDNYFKIVDGVNSSYLNITTPSPLPNARVGTNYSATLSATGGSDSYYWGVVSGPSAPPSLSLTTGACVTNPCRISAMISGTPTQSGTYIFTITLTSGTQITSKQFTLTIEPNTIPFR